MSRVIRFADPAIVQTHGVELSFRLMPMFCFATGRPAFFHPD